MSKRFIRLSPNYHGLIVFGLALGSLLVGIVLARGIKAHDEIVSVSPFSSPVDRKSEVRISGLIKSVPVVDYTPHRETFAGATFNAVNIIVRYAAPNVPPQDFIKSRGDQTHTGARIL